MDIKPSVNSEVFASLNKKLSRFSNELNRDENVMMTTILDHFIDFQEASVRSNIIQSLMKVNDIIEDLRSEVRVNKDEKTKEHLLSAQDELDNVVHMMEDATHIILDQAEKLTLLENDVSHEHKEKFQEITQKIFEACSFQDLSGQRLQKTVNILKFIEEQVHKVLEEVVLFDEVKSDEPKGDPTNFSRSHHSKLSHDPLLNGPGKGNSQDDVDKLFE